MWGSCFIYKEVTVVGEISFNWGAGGERHSDLCSASVHRESDTHSSENQTHASQKRISFKAKLDYSDGPNGGVISHGLFLRELDSLRDPMVGK